MKPEKQFADAHTRFKTADAEVARLSVRLDDVVQKRLQAGIDAAAIDREIDTFTLSGNFESPAAGSLVQKQANARNALVLFDRSIDHLNRELALAKIGLLKAETDCAAAQYAYHDAAIDEGCKEFLRTNAPMLQKIMRSMYILSGCSEARTAGIVIGKQHASTNIEQLFINVMPRAVSDELSNDEAFHAACLAPVKNQPITEFVVSANLTAMDRAILQQRAHLTPDEQAEAMIDASKPEPIQPFNVTLAWNAARDAAEKAEYHRSQARYYQQRFELRPSDTGLRDNATKHAEFADKFDNMVAQLDERIQAHRMAA